MARCAPGVSDTGTALTLACAQRLAAHEGLRLRTIRLRALADAPDAFGSTYDESAARPLDSWAAQLQEIATFVAVVDGEDVGLVRGARDDLQPDAAWLRVFAALSLRHLRGGEAKQNQSELIEKLAAPEPASLRVRRAGRRRDASGSPPHGWSRRRE